MMVHALRECVFFFFSTTQEAKELKEMVSLWNMEGCRKEHLSLTYKSQHYIFPPNIVFDDGSESNLDSATYL